MKIKTFVSNNFGDLPLNRYLYKKITGEEPRFINLDCQTKKFHYLLSGSVLSNMSSKSIVWGSGFIQQNSYFKSKPRRIYAVRGKLSWEALYKNKIKAPYVFGDPCLLLPRFFDPQVKKKYEIGLIPHYTEIKSSLVTQHENIKIIDICGDVETVIKEVLQCKRIMSSSLHGLILADTYNIPNLWVAIDNNIQGMGFKYYDYFSITNRNPATRLQIKNGMKLEQYFEYCIKNKITIDLDRFWEVCPLRRENVRSVEEL